jgi:beta-lactam-binding protein with PASTA domain
VPKPAPKPAPGPNPTPPQGNTTVKGTIVDANPKAVRVSYKWPNGQVVSPIIPGNNTYTKGDDVDVVITWVNNKDPEWQKQWNKRFGNLSITELEAEAETNLQAPIKQDSDRFSSSD